MTTKTLAIELALLAGAVSGWLLLLAVRALMRQLSAREIAVLPVVASQVVRLDAGGAVVLALRGRQFRTGFGQASFDLRDAQRGESVPARPLIVRSRSSGLDGQVTLSVRRFELAAAGSSELTAAGLPAGTDFRDARLVLLRADGPALARRIAAVVASAIGLVGALVAAVLLGSGMPRV